MNYLLHVLLAVIVSSPLSGASSALGDELPPVSLNKEAVSIPITPLPDPEELARHNRNAILGGEFLIGLYGATHWWKDGLTNDFRTVDEGWFGPETYAGGADKTGHLFFGYAGTRLLARGFEGLGNDPEHALWLGAVTTLGTLVAIETIDGFSKTWRFSKEDMVMNALGVWMGIQFEKSPRLDRLLDFRLMYCPSGPAIEQGRIDPIGDYSGQTYLLVVKAAGFPELRKYGPLRYLELAGGYGSRGYDSDAVLASPRSRNTYVGISLNLSEILDDTLFRDSRDGRARRITSTALKFIQVPGTAAALHDHSF
jgi:hypothetical protein